MQKYDFTAPSSGASQTINAPGRYLKYMTGNAGGNDASLIVTPGGKPGSKILLYPGQAITLPQAAAIPSAWTIANALGQANITGTVVVGDGRLDDNTLQGTVQVVDGGKARSLAAQAFCMVSASPATAGVYGKLGLWNPAGSQNRLILEAVAIADISAGVSANLLPYSAALPIDAGGVPSKLIGPSRGMSAAHVQLDNTAVATSTGPSFCVISAPTAGTQSYAFREPVVVMPGYGVVLWGDVVNTAFTGTFEWFEEPNV